jgi:hypothetical protein
MHYLAVGRHGVSGCRARRFPFHSACAALLVGVPMLNGCSLVLPHPSAAPPDRGIEECSLDILQYRRQLPKRIAAQGVAVPVIVRHVTPGAERLLRNGQAIYFVDTHPQADATRNPDSGDRQLISMNTSRLPKDSSIWILDAADKGPGATPEESVISARALIRLRASKGGYLRLVDGQPSVSANIEDASRLVVYKIDVPDSTRPTSCDESLRDGDFVFLEALEPNRWLDSSADGALHSTPADGTNAAACVQDRERCYTDDRGGLACAWGPKCSF